MSLWVAMFNYLVDCQYSMGSQDGDTSRAAHILTVSMYYEVMKQKWAFEKTLVT